MSDRVIIIRRWPPEFRLCTWCEQRQVGISEQKWCTPCATMIRRNQMEGWRGHRDDEEDSIESLGLQWLGIRNL